MYGDGENTSKIDVEKSRLALTAFVLVVMKRYRTPIQLQLHV